ncbi:MAG TPA: hypothetical protein VH518_03595, partial [Tepidisphaeraceae bacterium]
GLHAHGIVHGALHARNIIVDRDGKLHLTHVSPLLYGDPEQDEHAVQELLSRFVAARELPRNGANDDDRAARRLRRSSYLGALLAIGAGIVILWAILWYIRA